MSLTTQPSRQPSATSAAPDKQAVAREAVGGANADPALAAVAGQQRAGSLLDALATRPRAGFAAVLRRPRVPIRAPAPRGPATSSSGACHPRPTRGGGTAVVASRPPRCECPRATAREARPLPTATRRSAERARPSKCRSEPRGGPRVTSFRLRDRNCPASRTYSHHCGVLPKDGGLARRAAL